MYRCKELKEDLHVELPVVSSNFCDNGVDMEESFSFVANFLEQNYNVFFVVIIDEGYFFIDIPM